MMRSVSKKRTDAEVGAITPANTSPMQVFLFDFRSHHAFAIIHGLKRCGYRVVVGSDSVPRYSFGVDQFLKWDGSIESLVRLLTERGIHIVIPISIEAFRFCAENKSELLARGIRLLVVHAPSRPQSILDMS